jgi:hypothetical protein
MRRGRQAQCALDWWLGLVVSWVGVVREHFRETIDRTTFWMYQLSYRSPLANGKLIALDLHPSRNHSAARMTKTRLGCRCSGVNMGMERPRRGPRGEILLPLRLGPTFVRKGVTKPIQHLARENQVRSQLWQ